MDNTNNRPRTNSKLHTSSKLHTNNRANIKATAAEDVEEEDAVEDTPVVEGAEELDKVSTKEDIKDSNKEMLTKPQHQEVSTMDRTVHPTP